MMKQFYIITIFSFLSLLLFAEEKPFLVITNPDGSTSEYDFSLFRCAKISNKYDSPIVFNVNLIDDSKMLNSSGVVKRVVREVEPTKILEENFSKDNVYVDGRTIFVNSMSNALITVFDMSGRNINNPIFSSQYKQTVNQSGIFIVSVDNRKYKIEVK